MEKLTVDLTADDAQHLDAIVEYFAAGRFGVEISRADAVRIAVRELHERVKPNPVINDCGLSEAERLKMREDAR